MHDIVGFDTATQRHLRLRCGASFSGSNRYNPVMDESPPLCPTCGQPASEALAGAEHDWECRNEACPEFGQPVGADEPREEAGSPDR